MKTQTYSKLALLTLVASFALTACGSGNAQSTDDRVRAAIGSESASVLIQEFSDLQCPACAAISPQVEKLIRDNPTLARLEYYHFPLPQHTNAFQTAEASECALDQGKFWEFTDLAFQNQSQLSTDNLKKFAGKLGLDQAQFDDCLDSGQKKNFVREDVAQGRRMGINSTPSLVVNGQYVRWNGYDEFKAYLESLQ